MLKHHLARAAANIVPVAPSRRSFLKGAASVGGALVLAAVLPLSPLAAEGAAPTIMGPADPRPMAFVRIAADNSVTVLIKHLDKGQGIATGLATIVAEELDADWSQIRSEFAPADRALYANHAFGLQGTGGSTSVGNSWDELRMAGAAARAMLVDAAATRWKVPASDITVAKGVISHSASGKTASFGELAEDAAKLPVPAKVSLKTTDRFTLIGNADLHRLDHISKTDGTAIYAMDIRRDGQVTAVLARPERFGGVVKTVDDKAARAVAGVIDVVTVPAGVAVIARNTWSAMKGREALVIEWDDSKAEMRSTAAMLDDYRKLAKSAGAVANATGDAAKALAGAAKVIEGEFTFPYLAHAPMEPLNAVVELTGDGGCAIWAGSQFQGVEQMVAARILGCKPEQVAIHTQWAGGSFGRRATPNADYIAEAVMVAKAWNGKKPLHLVWTREDDIKGGRYRPLFLHQARLGLDKDGTLIGWEHRLVGQSFAVGSAFEAAMVKDGVDVTAVEGLSDLPYAVPNVAVDLHLTTSPVTTLWWRSVGHTHTAHAKEVLVNEAAVAAGKDPVEYRLAMLKDHPREAAVLKLVAEKADWNKPLPKGWGRGVAVHKSFGSYVAHVAEISVGDNGKIRIERIVCAVDCGIAVNPNVIEQQISGGTAWGIGHALHGEITLTDGVVDQSNFTDFTPLRLSEMPKVEVHILPSTERPSGVGEPGVPTASPALVNAIFNATGQRIHQLPINKAGVV